MGYSPQSCKEMVMTEVTEHTRCKAVVFRLQPASGSLELELILTGGWPQL